MGDTRLCRLCAQTKPSLMCVENVQIVWDGTSVADLARHYLALTINSVDLICVECNNHLFTFHEFANKVRDAQEKFYNTTNFSSDFRIINPLSIINNCEAGVPNFENGEFESGEKMLVADCKQDLNNHVKFEPQCNIKEEMKTEDSDLDDFPNEDHHIIMTPEVNLVCEDNANESSDDFLDKIFKGNDQNGKKKKKGRPRRQMRQRGKNSNENVTVKVEDEIKSETKKMKKHWKSMNLKIKPLDVDEKPVICYICKDIFGNMHDLRKHLKTHISECTDILKWPCTYCAKKFKNQSNAISHIRKVHERIYDCICHECGKMFCGFNELKDHLASHNTVLNYECDHCGRKFKTRTTVQQHMKVHEDKFYQCPQCPLLLKSQRTLRNHLAVHEEVGRHACSFCDKRFKLRKTLKHHINLHTGQRPYECMWCVKTFTNDSNLRIHKKRVHKRELLKYEEENNINHAERYARRAYRPEPTGTEPTNMGLGQQNVANYSNNPIELVKIKNKKPQKNENDDMKFSENEIKLSEDEMKLSGDEMKMSESEMKLPEMKMSENEMKLSGYEMKLTGPEMFLMDYRIRNAYEEMALEKLGD